MIIDWNRNIDSLGSSELLPMDDGDYYSNTESFKPRAPISKK